MLTFVCPLEEAPDDASLVGGKGAALGRLLRSGVTVPPGFVLTADAFRSYLHANGLDAAFSAQGAQEPSDADVLSRLRAGAWPEGVRATLVTAYSALSERTRGGPLAVRSSATAEDSSAASFAGQHATLLNIQGFAALLDAILECWASLYSTEALYYRRARSVQDDEPTMAVVVQALIPAEASGVAFTLDPVSGDSDLVLIDAAFGLGQGVVDGAVTPDHFGVRKEDGSIVRRAVAAKSIRVVPALSGEGTVREELSDERSRQAALSDAQVIELGRLAAAIEERWGCAQDIEWALAGGRFFILQSRPVTAAAPAPDGSPNEGWVSEFDTDTDPDTIWTSANVQEVLPDQLSPFGVSITRDIMERFGLEPIERIGIRLSTKDPFSAYFYGRAFLNVTLMLEIADQTPFGSVEAIMEQFFGQRRDEVGPPKRPSLARLLRYAVVLPRMLWFSNRMPAEIREAEKIIAAFDREDGARPLDQQSDEGLVRTLERDLPRSGQVAIAHVSGGGVTSSAFEWLRRCTEAWLGDASGVLQARLCTGLASVESAQPAYDLWELSRLVLTSDPLLRAFDAADPLEIERHLAAQENADRDAFSRRLDAFLVRHGHRSVMEAEAAAKTWDEDRPTVLAMIRNYLHADPAADPRRIEERQQRERAAATDGAMRRLRFWQRPIFRYVLSQAQEWIRTREHTKSLLVLGTHHGRRLTRELARRMVEHGMLRELWDFYYLTWDEAKALLRGELTGEQAAEQVERRKAEEGRNRQVVLAETFQGRPTPLRPEDLPLPEGHVLHGIAVSPGRVTGRARVILDPRRDAAIEPGEILVAPVTDAGWTPLFVAAAAIVVDVGGSLSHGSTVAREYGLPAVVNVKHGTRMIRTGQTITVDGTQGVVVLEDLDAVGP